MLTPVTELQALGYKDVQRCTQYQLSLLKTESNALLKLDTHLPISTIFNPFVQFQPFSTHGHSPHFFNIPLLFHKPQISHFLVDSPRWLFVAWYKPPKSDRQRGP